MKPVQEAELNCDETNHNCITKSLWGRRNTLKFPFPNYFRVLPRDGSYIVFSVALPPALLLG